MIIRIPPAMRHRQFRFYWFGIMFAWAGFQIQSWALFWHIRTLTDQPLAAGAVGLIRFIPTILLSLLAGVIADRFNRRNVLILTQLALAIAVSALGFLTASGRTTLGVIYGMVALGSIVLTFELPAKESLLPNLVPKEDIANAFSMHAVGFQIGSLSGPVLNGILINSFGLRTSYYLSGLAFLVMIVCLALMGPVSQQKSPASGEKVRWDEIRQGIRFTFRNPLILSSMLLDFFATAFTRADTFIPFIARDILKVGALGYGLLSAGQSIGAVTTGIALTQFKKIRRQGVVLMLAVTAVGTGTILFGSSRLFLLSFFALALVGGADAISSVVRNTIRQIQTPDSIRGRMVSVNQIFFMGGPQLGEVRAGLVAGLIGVPMAIATGGLACLLAMVWIARRWPQLQKYDGEVSALSLAV